MKLKSSVTKSRGNKMFRGILEMKSHISRNELHALVSQNLTLYQKAIKLNWKFVFRNASHLFQYRNKFNCKSKWKPRRQHACNTLQAELDTWGYFCCQYAPTHKSPLLSLVMFTYSRGSLCKWVLSDDGLLQAIIILLYHYF